MNINYFLMLLSLGLFISCGGDEADPNLGMISLCDDEGITLPLNHIEKFEVAPDMPFEDLELCDEARPVMATSTNVSGKIHQDIYGDYWLRTFTVPPGSVGDSHYNSMICCGLPDRYKDSIGVNITYSGIYRSQDGITPTSDLIIMPNGDISREAIGGQSFNIVKIIEIVE